MKINHLDLFSGIGGFALGLEMAGFTFGWHGFSEIDEYAIKVYRRHYPDAKPLGSVTDIDGRSLPRIDILTGGFPCQDISQAGKQVGLGGARSGLFHEIVRIAKDCRPRILFLENVANLLTINGGGDFGTVLRELAAIGYDAEWHCVPASHVGAYHGRDRIWIVAYPVRSRSQGGFQEQKNIIEANTKPSSEMASRCFDGTLQQDGRTWPRTPGVRRVAYGIPNRIHRLKCLGNAVVPQVVAYLAASIIRPILEEQQ